MAGTATATAPAGASGAQAQQAAPPAAPFRAGTFRTLSSDGYNVSQVLGTTSEPLTPYSPSPNAYIRGIWIQAVMTASGNSATVAFQPDAPPIAYSSITFQDANEKPIIGPFDGYTLMCVNKFGAYQRLSDPRANAVWSVTTGSGGSGGSFTMVLYVPLEIVSRDALGTLQNKSSSSSFQLNLTVNTLANVYSTAPTSAPTLVTTCYEDGWVQPKSTDLSGTPLTGAPPHLGTTQYWTRGSYNSLNGAQQIQLTQGLGYPIRNFMAVNYDVSAGTRSAGDTDWPTTTQFLFKGTSMWNISKTLWKQQMSQTFGLSSTTADAANGLENGVYILPFDMDFDLGPGAELRNGYLGTQQGDQFQDVASWNGNSTMYWVANYVAPAAGPTNLASIRAGR
ncbi:MAG TPA: hypothetical protein VN870_00755 [Streptosporangiaceae bacterium]|nr:hypothetical protein [Streptosporangiaceae bacterium]